MGLTEVSSIDSMFDYSGLIPRYFDVVVQGGGPNAVYLLGLYDTFKKLENTGDIRVSRYVASGVAAILCVLLCCHVEKQTMVDFCHHMFDDITNNRWKKELLGILPQDAYIVCSDRVLIYTSIPVCSWLYFYRRFRVFSVYRSNRDLAEACCLSFQKPSRVHSYSGKQRQLRIRLDALHERFDRFVFSPKCLFQFYRVARMTELVLKAEQDAGDFFLCHPTPVLPNNLLQWYDGISHRGYRMLCCFFLPSVAVLYFFFRERPQLRQ